MTRRMTAWIGALFVLGACSDPAGPTGDRLTRAEAMLIADDVAARGQQTTTASRPGSASLTIASDPITIDNELELTLPCPRGGELQQTWKASGTFDLRAGSYDLDIEGVQTHMDCAYLHEGLTITINGNPDIELNAHASGREHRPSGTHTLEINGSFRWQASDGRSGACPITLEAITNWAEKKRTVDGDICGHTIRESLTW